MSNEISRLKEENKVLRRMISQWMNHAARAECREMKELRDELESLTVKLESARVR